MEDYEKKEHLYIPSKPPFEKGRLVASLRLVPLWSVSVLSLLNRLTKWRIMKKEHLYIPSKPPFEKGRLNPASQAFPPCSSA